MCFLAPNLVRAGEGQGTVHPGLSISHSHTYYYNDLRMSKSISLIFLSALPNEIGKKSEKNNKQLKWHDQAWFRTYFENVYL